MTWLVQKGSDCCYIWCTDPENKFFDTIYTFDKTDLDLMQIKLEYGRIYKIESCNIKLSVYPYQKKNTKLFKLKLGGKS